MRPVRWDLVEKFDVLKKGRFARARKAFTGAEDFFAEHFPGKPLVPEPFFIEMIAQTGGVLFGLGMDFQKEVILAKIENARFFKPVAPPCALIVEAGIEEAREEGAWISGVVSQGSEKVAQAKILLAAVDSLTGRKNGKIVFNENFLKQYRIYEVARTSEAFVK